jgi:integrase/recombinase XerD
MRVPARDLIPISKESLTPAEFNAHSDIPPELEWLANISNAKTRRFYKSDVTEFLAFSGLKDIKSPSVAFARLAARGEALSSRTPSGELCLSTLEQ